MSTVLPNRPSGGVITRPPSEPGGRDTEFAYTPLDFKRIAEILHADCGIALSESKMNLVYSRLAKRLRAHGFKSFRDYCRLVTSPEGVDERQTMIAAMTTNVTRFFREPHHFEHLRNVQLQRLSVQLNAGKRVRIWSAGCSTGEEPYSIAMTVLSGMPRAAESDFRILATDIDPNVIAQGCAAAYPESIVAESVPKELIKPNFVREKSAGEANYRIAERTRSVVRFNQLNLLSAWPMKGLFDAIFCRNVMIYFDEETQLALCRRFAESLQPGGVLYIGHSERLPEDELPFELCGHTTYVKRQEKL